MVLVFVCIALLRVQVVISTHAKSEGRHVETKHQPIKSRLAPFLCRGFGYWPCCIIKLVKDNIHDPGPHYSRYAIRDNNI
jgi:hypothetical protein